MATIRFPLIFLLVFLHNDRGGEFSSRLHDAPATAWGIHLLADGFGGIRIPTFFLIGGYVYFRSLEPTVRGFCAKIGSRVRTLLVPLVLWNVLALLGLGVVRELPLPVLAASSAWQAPLFQRTPEQWFAALFGLPTVQPFVYPLWFLHDLFVLVLLSPLIYALIRATRGWLPAVAFAVWALGIPNGMVAKDALFFFILGSALAIARRSLFLLDGLGPLAVVGWCVLQAVDGSPLLDPVAWKIKALLGVVAALFASGVLARRRTVADALRASARCSFFVFAAHEPLLTFVRRAAFRFLDPTTPGAVFVTYVGVALTTIVLLIVAFRVAERTAPRLLVLLTGGRSRPGGALRLRPRGDSFPTTPLPKADSSA